MCNQELPKKVNRDDLMKIVYVFKMCQGVEKEDKGWDRVYFPRFSKPAKELLQLLGDWKAAADCVQEIYEKYTSLGFTVTMETIIKHATEWRKDRREKEASHGVFPVQGDGNRASVIRPD